MTLGYWSPMPPAPTGVADYSASLIPFLREYGEVRVNASGDLNLYHIGNNPLHREIYQRALAEPGIVVLHDAVLQHFFLGMLDDREYVEEFVFNYGKWSRAEAETLWRERARSGSDPRYFARPMLKRILTSARAVIVHNPAAMEVALAHAPATEIFEIPHLFVPPELADPAAILRFRREFGLTEGTLLVGAFGHQRETKRLHVLLRAFDRACARGANARLLVSGEFVSRAFEDSLAPLLNRPHILRTGYLEERDFWKHLAATDVCINLRYPSASETSGVAVRMMGIGKTVVFTRDRSNSRFPDDSCLRIDVGSAEEETLADYIVWLAEACVAEAIGRNAACYIAREHAPERAARLYWDAVNKM